MSEKFDYDVSKGGSKGAPVQKGSWWSRQSTRRKIIIAILAVMICSALAIGLGVGLTVGGSESNSSTSAPANGTSTTTNGTITNGTSASIWTPKNGTSWQIEIQNPLANTTGDFEVWDIDLFNNTAETIAGLHAQNRKVMCYFSAGSYEDWRPDVPQFKPGDLGSPLAGWPGERWLKTNSSNVRNIMLARLDLAVTKRCDGIDPDNVDGYDNNNGLDLTQPDAIEYVNFLADAAHGRNLSIGLKNAGSIIPQVIGKMQWSVNEQCVQNNECDLYQPFIQQGKPVFHIEYPSAGPQVSIKVKTSVCDNAQAQGFSTVLKKMGLDDWVDPCPLP